LLRVSDTIQNESNCVLIFFKMLPSPRKNLIVIALACLCLSACQQPSNEHVVHQIATLHALSQGAYDGTMTYKQLAQYGDFGVGTYDKLDGEMVALDGDFYQIKSSGIVSKAGATQTTPYSSIHFFHSDSTSFSGALESFDALKTKLSSLIQHKDRVYGIKIKATCSGLKLRSPKRQEIPYLPLADVLKDQSIFNKENITGTFVGYYSPADLGAITAPGFHLHFISDDRKTGGHVLDLTITRAEIYLDELSGLQLHFSDTSQ